MSTAVALAAVAVVIARPAGAAGTVTVSPSENLVHAQLVTVTGSDIPAGGLGITQCGNADAGGTALPGDGPAIADCHAPGGDTFVFVNGPDFTWENYPVSTSGIGESGRTCIPVAQANFPCMIMVAALFGDLIYTVPISFADPGPGDPPPDDEPPRDEPPPPADPLGDGGFCQGAPDGNPFTDLDQESTTTRETTLCLVATGLTTGTSPTEYTPGGQVSRRQMAVFITRLADLADSLEAEGASIPALPEYDGTPDFSDVSADDPGAAQIGRLSQGGIVGGISDDVYGTNAVVTRRQMAAFVVRLLNFLGEAPGTDADYFADDNGDPGEGNLNTVASLGIFVGDGSGDVGPGHPMTRRQMANVLMRTAQVLLDSGRVHGPFTGSSVP